MPKAQGSFTYYCAGVDFYMFTCWNVDHTSCGTHSVRGGAELRNNIDALVGMGYVDRTRSREHWNYQAKAWLPDARTSDLPPAKVA